MLKPAVVYHVGKHRQVSKIVFWPILFNLGKMGILRRRVFGHIGLSDDFHVCLTMLTAIAYLKGVPVEQGR